jgi:hypothetical protein
MKKKNTKRELYICAIKNNIKKAKNEKHSKREREREREKIVLL